jgi:hypothetical protein
MKQFASAENADLVNRFRATLALSYMYQTGTLDASVLPLINDFAMQVPHTVAWRLVFSKVKPYWHLFPSQRVELLALVAWLLAHTSLTGALTSIRVLWVLTRDIRDRQGRHQY